MTSLARKGLILYFSILVAGSAIIEWILIRTGEPIENHLGLVLLLMWTPGIASLIARFVLREGLRDISFRFGGKPAVKPMLIAWFFPLAVGILAYGGAWSAGLVSFEMQSEPWLPESKGLAAFLLLASVRLSIGVVIAAIAAAGEEIGWRGYMITRLIQAGVPYPVFLSGLIWGLWHTPLILTGQYVASPNPVLSAGLFLAVTVAIGFLLARVRLESGSVWPAIIGHAAWNSTIQGLFDFSSAGESKAFWVGESGILVIATTIVLVFVLVRRPFQALRSPGEPLQHPG
jgi:membrane protease YdiL (CAAX protease family)